MEENWDDTDYLQEPQNTSSFNESQGRSYGKGRGFVPQNNNDNDFGIGKMTINNQYENSSGIGTNEDDSAWDDKGENSEEPDFSSSGNSNPFGGGQSSNRSNGGGRGRGRGGRDGRGGSNNFRGRREDNEFDDNKSNSFDNPFGNGGGRRNRRNDFDNGDDENGDSNDMDSGFRRGRGGGGDRGRGGRGRGRGRGGRGGGNDDRGDDNEGRRGGSDNRRGNFDSEDGNGPTEEKPKPVTYIPPEPKDDEESLFQEGVTMGINFDKYDSIDVRVTGENVPPAINTFDEANLRGLLLDNIKKSGYKKPTPVQKHAIPIVMSGRDLMACAQTGSGKTAAFLIPIIHTLLAAPVDLDLTQPQVVIVSPTRELAIQIWGQVKKFANGSVLKTAIAYGGTAVQYQGNKIASGCHILVATPGRLMDFVGKGRINFGGVRFLVLDEADRMLDMGFLPDMERMLDHETMVPIGEKQTLMFSATFPKEIQELAARFLRNYLFLAVGIVGSACSDVVQTFHEVSKFKKRETLKQIIEQETDLKNERILIFVETKRTTDFIAAFLSENNFPTTSIHGAREQREREEALYQFTKGNMYILVATDVASRGLDIKNVAHVINYDLPKDIDSYVHRIGRTGRVGNRGKATSFFDPDTNGPLVPDLVRILKQAKQSIPEFLQCDGGSRTFAPGKSQMFGGEDVRDFNTNDGAYGGGGDDFTTAAAEPDEVW